MTLQDKLKAKRFVLTAEVTPPVSADRGELLAKALPLKGLADAVNITDGAGARPHLGALTAAALLVEHGIEPVLQLTCRDRNRIALQSDLIECCGFGRAQSADAARRRSKRRRSARGQARVRSRSAPASGNRAQACATKANCRPAARSAAAPISFSAPPTIRSIRRAAGSRHRLHAKIEAGAQFVQTQFCMDAGVIRRYVERLAEHGITGKLSLIVGVVPLRSAKSARWIKEKLFGAIIPDALIARMEAASDPAAEGRRICLDLVAELAGIPHVAGCHIMAPNNDAVVPEIIGAARDSIKRLAAV